MKNKLILFDWGNIVEADTVGHSSMIAWNDLLKKCGYKGEENLYYNLSKYRFSRIKNDEEFKKAYQSMKEDFNLTATYDYFVENYKVIFDGIDYFKEVADYEKSLKDKCYIGIFSNLTIFDKERLDKQVDLSKYDYVFLSFEMGLRKPEAKIYEYEQEHVPFEPEDILFIDDKKINIDNASKAGWDTLQATGLELDKIKQKCEEFLTK